MNQEPFREVIVVQDKYLRKEYSMKKNVGTADRIIRIIIGLVIVALGIYYKSWWGLLAIIPLGTAVVGFCCLYPLFGINTCKKERPANTN
jgi:hypothetical protein